MTAGVIAYQWVKEAGMEEFVRLSAIGTCLLQQSSKKTDNEECIRKDQRPNAHSLETNLNSSHAICLEIVGYLASGHLFFLIFESFFHGLNDAKTNYHEYKNYK